MITIAICNHKGGVGKTTTAFNLASKLAYEGAVVVLVDLDPQSNLTQAAGIAEEDARQGDVYKALQGKFVGMNGKAKLQTLGKRMLLNNEETNQETGELHIAPSTLDLSAAELELLGLLTKSYFLCCHLEIL
jgi:chromosome partitioning protein